LLELGGGGGGRTGFTEDDAARGEGWDGVADGTTGGSGDGEAGEADEEGEKYGGGPRVAARASGTRASGTRGTEPGDAAVPQPIGVSSSLS